MSLILDRPSSQQPYKSGGLLMSIKLLHQAGFAAGSIVLMDNTLASGFIKRATGLAHRVLAFTIAEN